MGQLTDKIEIEQMIQEKKIDSFTANERRLFDRQPLEGRDYYDALWRYESLNVLLWALGIVDELVFPSEYCDSRAIDELMRSLPRKEFEAQVRPRSKDELLDELDKTYRMHWAARQARQEGTVPEGGMIWGVVYERHYALNWLTRYCNQPWEEITTDT